MNAFKFNSYLRTFLKLAALFAMAYWARILVVKYSIFLNFLIVFAILLFALIIWSGFGVKQDPFRSVKPLIPVSGVIRIAIELFYFGFAIYCLYAAGLYRLTWIYSNLVILHFAFSHRRIAILLKK